MALAPAEPYPPFRRGSRKGKKREEKFFTAFPV